jgi:hypothetical protein
MPYCIYHMRRVTFSNENILVNLTSFCLEIFAEQTEGGEDCHPLASVDVPLALAQVQSKASANVVRRGAD